VRAKRIRQVQALTLAAALVGWGIAVKPRMSGPPRPLLQAALGTALVVITRAPLGLRPPALWSGVRLGLTASAAVAVAVTGATAMPAIRTALAARPVPEPIPHWLLLRIPVGTVWSEEAAFRAALATVATEAFGPRWGQLLQAGAFGLWHIPDARSAGEPVIGTVLVTGAAGWVCGWLQERSGSLAAPMLAHLAVNEAGAVAALALQRRR
jgi:uncharacterized protein